MKRLFLFLAAAFLLASISSTASARIVTPLPGVANQVTTTGAYFGIPIAVKVTEDSGEPVAGIQVNFDDNDGNALFAGAGFSLSSDTAAFTGPDGVAVALPLLGMFPGVTALSATTVGNPVTTTSFQLTVVAGGAASIKVVSGSHQHSPVGYTYPHPWVAQALKADGAPAPFAVVQFYATTEPGIASVTFDGASSVFVFADENGIVVSPYVKANDIKGHEEGLALGFNTSGPVRAAIFDYVNLPAPAATRCVKGKGPPCGP